MIYGRPQLVYFIQCNGADGPVKIGIAVDPQRRLSELRIGCPYPMELLATAVVEDADLAERRLHMRFAARRIHGEWFECHPQLLEIARAIAREAVMDKVGDLLSAIPARRPVYGPRVRRARVVTP